MMNLGLGLGLGFGAKGGLFLPSQVAGNVLWLRGDIGKTLATSPVVATGTTPPAVTLTGTPNAAYDFRIEITTLGARGTAVFRWSSDGGSTYTSGVLTAATAALGATGVTANFAVGVYATDDVYVAFSSVSGWADGSELGNDATMATAANQPKDGANFLSFAQSLEQRIVAAGVASHADPCEVFAVIRYAAVGASAYIFDHVGGNVYACSVQSDLTTRLYNGASLIGPSVVAGTDAIVDAVGNGASSSIAISGGTATVGNAGSAIVPAGLAIGNYYSGGAGVAFNGRIYEVIQYNNKLSAPDRASVIAYLKAKYGIA